LAHLRVNFEGDKGEWFDLLMIEINTIDDYISDTGWVCEQVIEPDDPLDSAYGIVLRNRR